MKAIGIDVGGSKIRAVRVRLAHRERWNGTRVEKLVVAKTPRSAAALTKILRRIIVSLEEHEAFSVGIGFAGVVQDRKIVMSPNNRFLKHYDPSRALGRAVTIDNDARVFARAEYAMGAAKGAQRALFLTFGTGVGRAYGIGSEVKRVKRFEYPEQWEKHYQHVKGVAALAPFLAEKLQPLIRAYQPAVIVAGGAVAEKKGFIAAFRAELKKRGFKDVVAGAKLGTLAGAIGAAMTARAK
ncbi:MAG: ROK family protein [Candidatus Brennerbacteria bacterium]|nr:ROK family protein [Candidatus Brennerbacteria bacterium]